MMYQSRYFLWIVCLKILITKYLLPNYKPLIITAKLLLLLSIAKLIIIDKE